jgi:hypothetical protein
MAIEPHSTRLFPKQLGADAYRLTGVAARCDWVVLSDTREPRVRLRRRTPRGEPRHVFLSLRSPFDALRYMAEEVLPLLTRPFVLISGSEDVTIPNQRDLRWRRFNDAERGHIDTILSHPLLCRWFAENLDEAAHRLLSPMPVGLVFAAGPPSTPWIVPDPPPLSSRPLRILCAHRTRQGPQWEVRRHVTEIARTHWAPLCTVLEEEVPEAEFMRQLAQHAFVLCVEGGGLDPSPKAWQALLHGAIPIVRDSPLRAAYAELPVAFVQDWTAGSIDRSRLDEWRSSGADMQDVPANRARVVLRLGLDHWWAKVVEALPPEHH